MVQNDKEAISNRSGPALAKSPATKMLLPKEMTTKSSRTKDYSNREYNAQQECL